MELSFWGSKRGGGCGTRGIAVRFKKEGGGVGGDSGPGNRGLISVWGR